MLLADDGVGCAVDLGESKESGNERIFECEWYQHTRKERVSEGTTSEEQRSASTYCEQTNLGHGSLVATVELLGQLVPGGGEVHAVAAPTEIKERKKEGREDIS